MKKSLIALAVAGVFAAPVAMADTANVNVYGHANVSYDLTNNGTSTAGVAGTSANKVSDNASYIGVKGSEDLGGGTSAIWQLETAVSLDGAAAGTSTLGTRDSFAGLSGDSWGTLILGQHDTPYKLSTRGLDMFADTIADNRSLMGMTGGSAGVSHDARLGNVVAYISPAMSGFTAAVAYVAAAENAAASTDSKGSAWSLAGMYGAGPINAALAYQVVDGGTAAACSLPVALCLAANDKATAWKIGGGYTMDAFAVNAVYEKNSSSIAGVDAAGQSNWYLAGKFNVSASDAVKLAYTKAGTFGSPATPDSGAKQISLGYDHNMSKRTTVYALYTKVSNNAAASYTVGGGVTTGTVIPAGLGGASPSAWSLGMKHTF